MSSLPASLPSLPSTWTAPTSCFATTNYFRVLLGSGYFSNMYGTPTPVLTGNYPTGDCFPPSTTPGVPYLTDGPCPSGYTRACATAGPESNGKPVSTVTCCPRFVSSILLIHTHVPNMHATSKKLTSNRSVTDNVFSFMCRNNEYGCHATATPGVVWTGVITDIGLETPTEQPVTRKPSTDEGIEAWGIKFILVRPSYLKVRRRTLTSLMSLGGRGVYNRRFARYTKQDGRRPARAIVRPAGTNVGEWWLVSGCESRHRGRGRPRRCSLGPRSILSVSEEKEEG